MQREYDNYLNENPKKTHKKGHESSKKSQKKSVKKCIQIPDSERLERMEMNSLAAQSVVHSHN